MSLLPGPTNALINLNNPALVAAFRPKDSGRFLVPPRLDQQTKAMQQRRKQLDLQALHRVRERLAQKRRCPVAGYRVALSWRDAGLRSLSPP
jgi:DNA-binding MurR/RpiR family transcriptional regulator